MARVIILEILFCYIKVIVETLTLYELYMKQNIAHYFNIPTILEETVAISPLYSVNHHKKHKHKISIFTACMGSVQTEMFLTRYLLVLVLVCWSHLKFKLVYSGPTSPPVQDYLPLYTYWLYHGYYGYSEAGILTLM